MSNICTQCNNSMYSHECCNKQCRYCCNGCNHKNRKYRVKFYKCSICEIDIQLCKCCNKYCNQCCKNNCFNNKIVKLVKQSALEINKESISSNHSLIFSDDIELLKYYLKIKDILLSYLNDNVVELIINFIDTRKRCYDCNILFDKNDIYPEICNNCKEEYCDICISGTQYILCEIKNCYYCNRGYCYNNKLYYYCKNCNDTILSGVSDTIDSPDNN